MKTGVIDFTAKEEFGPDCRVEITWRVPADGLSKYARDVLETSASLIQDVADCQRRHEEVNKEPEPEGKA